MNNQEEKFRCPLGPGCHLRDPTKTATFSDKKELNRHKKVHQERLDRKRRRSVLPEDGEGVGVRRAARRRSGLGAAQTNTTQRR